MTSVLTSVEATLGYDMLQKIKSSKILLVGAGGIGCELLKNLALTGFSHIHVIDLDTIDVSNLNRQLLFRSHHVGKPKCTVAAQVASEMAPEAVDYVAHHGNVCDNDFFNVAFVAGFDLVLNALDNVTARRRVNRLCLAAKVPLVEAGTTGYLGQVNVIDKDSDIACYECKTQEAPKVYPICTIRSTPSMPVHTIVWAKEFYKLLFGDKVEESMLYEDEESEPSTYMQAVQDFRKQFQEKQVTVETIQTLVTKFYAEEIQKQLDMDRYKTARKTPKPLEASVVEAGVASTKPPTSSPNYRQTDIWSQEECIAEFVSCLTTRAAPGQVLPEFDKDDGLSMTFVTATSNLRSYVFGIDRESFYSAKGIAGNIIPAIATTNAIAAGLQILQTFSILKKQLETGSKTGGLAECCKYNNIERHPTRKGIYLTAAKLEAPNPKCFVCRMAMVPLHLTLKNWTLADFVERIVKKDLGFEQPMIMLEGDTVYEEGEDADEGFLKNLPKMLDELPCGGIKDQTVVSIEDLSQDLSVEVTVSNQDVFEKQEGETDEDIKLKFYIGGDKPIAKQEQKPQATEEGENEDDDDIEVVVDGASKRARAENGDEPPAKRTKKNGNGENKPNNLMEVIEID